MSNFTPFASALGGVLLGLATAALMLFDGRIAGISGIVAGGVERTGDDRRWRVAFVLGLVAGGLVLLGIAPGSIGPVAEPSLLRLGLAGILVGVGTRLANGCTSGHGICGLSRRSPRSIVATCTFMALAGVVVFLTRHVAGGAS